jgi:hypothetical protein
MKLSFALAAYNTKDEKDKKALESLAKENFYGLEPDMKRLYNKNKFVQQQAIKTYLAELVPAIGALSQIGSTASEAGTDLANIIGKVKDGKSLTESEKSRLELANLGINAIHLALMTQGGGLPSYFDIVKIVNQGNRKKDEKEDRRDNSATETRSRY